MTKFTEGTKVQFHQKAGDGKFQVNDGIVTDTREDEVFVEWDDGMEDWIDEDKEDLILHPDEK